MQSASFQSRIEVRLLNTAEQQFAKLEAWALVANPSTAREFDKKEGKDEDETPQLESQLKLVSTEKLLRLISKCGWRWCHFVWRDGLSATLFIF